MKILKKESVENNSKFPMRCTCEYCESELEVDKNDVEIGELGLFKYKCPVCLKLNDLDGEGINLTVENIEYPRHFFDFNNGKCVDNEEINKDIKRLVNSLRNSNDKNDTVRYTSYGDLFIFVQKLYDDEEYYIMVAKGYKDSYIPFEKRDYK